MKKFLLLYLIFFAAAKADYVSIGGYGSIGASSDAPEYVIGDQFIIGESSAVAVAVPSNMQGQITDVAVDSYRGTVLYVGQDQNNAPLILIGSVVSSTVTSIAAPSNIGFGAFISAAFDSDGNAILVGGGQDPSANIPWIYKLKVGGAQLIPISVPNANEGVLYSVVIAPNNTAVLAGWNSTDNVPLILSLPSNASQALLVSDPLMANGYLTTAAMGSNGTAILGGINTTVGDGQALIYSLNQGSLTATPIAVPNSNDGSTINAVAIGSDNTAILGGFIGTGPAFPLIYRVSAGSSSASLISNPDDHEGTILAVAISSNGTAILAGSDNSTLLPLIYKLAPGLTQPTTVQPPNPLDGAILSAAIGSQDVAILCGGYFDTPQALLFALPIASNQASLITTVDHEDDINMTSVAIYSFNGLYDVRRMRPYYYLQKSATIAEVH